MRRAHLPSGSAALRRYLPSSLSPPCGERVAECRVRGAFLVRLDAPGWKHANQAYRLPLIRRVAPPSPRLRGEGKRQVSRLRGEGKEHAPLAGRRGATPPLEDFEQALRSSALALARGLLFFCSCTARAGARANAAGGPKGERQDGVSQRKAGKRKHFSPTNQSRSRIAIEKRRASCPPPDGSGNILVACCYTRSKTRNRLNRKCSSATRSSTLYRARTAWRRRG